MHVTPWQPLPYPGKQGHQQMQNPAQQPPGPLLSERLIHLQKLRLQCIFLKFSVGTFGQNEH